MSKEPEDPPHWLQVGDENWGPTDLRKRGPRPIVKPRFPLDPEPEEESEWRKAVKFLLWVAVLLLAALVMIWLRSG
jgi:hypothetical protein